jgi:hypothetical protein
MVLSATDYSDSRLSGAMLVCPAVVKTAQDTPLDHSGSLGQSELFLLTLECGEEQLRGGSRRDLLLSGYLRTLRGTSSYVDEVRL